MPTIHEVATITSKGQITLPKSIRQALGVGYGGKVAFDLQGSQVIVTRAGLGTMKIPRLPVFWPCLRRIFAQVKTSAPYRTTWWRQCAQRLLTRLIFPPRLRAT